MVDMQSWWHTSCRSSRCSREGCESGWLQEPKQTQAHAQWSCSLWCSQKQEG